MRLGAQLTGAVVLCTIGLASAAATADQLYRICVIGKPGAKCSMAHDGQFSASYFNANLGNDQKLGREYCTYHIDGKPSVAPFSVALLAEEDGAKLMVVHCLTSGISAR